MTPLTPLKRMAKVPLVGRAEWMLNPCTVCHRKYWSPGRRVQVETIPNEYTPERRFRVTHESCLPAVVDAKVDAIVELYRETGSVFS